MAEVNFTYEVTVTPSNNPETIAQFLAPTNQRVKLTAIEVIPLGSTGATAPITWGLAIQDGAGTSADDSSSLQKTPPLADETIQTTVRKTFTAEPSGNSYIHTFGSHQQAPRTWMPPDGAIVIEGGDRVGLRYRSATFVNATYRFHLEE